MVKAAEEAAPKPPRKCYRPDCKILVQHRGRLLCDKHEEAFRKAGGKFTNMREFRAFLGIPEPVRAAAAAPVAKAKNTHAKAPAKAPAVVIVPRIPAPEQGAGMVQLVTEE